MMFRTKIACCLILAGGVAGLNTCFWQWENGRLSGAMQRLARYEEREVRGAEAARAAAGELGVFLQQLAERPARSGPADVANGLGAVRTVTGLASRLERGLQRAGGGRLDIGEEAGTRLGVEAGAFREVEAKAAERARAAVGAFNRAWGETVRQSGLGSGEVAALLPRVQGELLPACARYLDLVRQSRGRQAETVADAVEEQRWHLWAGGTLSLAALAGAGLFLLRSVGRPLHALVRKAEAVGEGGTGVRVRIGAGPLDEFGVLGRALNHTLDRLEAETVRRDELERRSAARDGELAQHEARFGRFVRASPVAASLSDLSSGEFFEVNEKFCELCGRSRDQLIGHTSVAIGLWHDEAGTREQLRAALGATGRFSDVEANFRRPDGSVCRVAMSAEVFDHRGRQAVLTGFFDISARAQVEGALREREQMLSSIIANLTGTCVFRMIYAPDGRMTCTFVSPNVGELIGLPAERFLADATSVFSLIHPDDLPLFRQRHTLAVRTGETASIATRLRPTWGGEMFVEFRSQLTERRPDGAQVRDGLVVDLTSVKVAEAELRGVRQRLELALRASRTCIWEDDLPANHLTLDPTWAEMRGYPSAATVTTWRSLVTTVHPEDRAAIMVQARRAIRGETEDYRVEQRVATAAGGWMWIMSHGRVTERDERGRARRIIGTNTDITERKRAEAELHRQAEFLAALNETALDLLNRRDLPDLLRTLIERAGLLLEAPNVELLLKAGDALVVQAFTSNVHATAGMAVSRDEAPLSWRAIDSGRTVVVADYAAFPHRPNHYDIHGPRSVIELPILRGSEALGVISLARSEPHRPFTDEEARRGEMLARQAALVLHNATIRADAVREAEARTLALRESEERHRAVFEHSPIAIGLLSVPEGRLVEFNAAGVKLFGHTREEALGRTSVELNLWADAGDRDRYLMELRTKGKVTGFETQMRRRNGELFTVLYSGSLVEIAGRIYSLNSIQDISARRRAEGALQESEERLAFALDATSDGLWDWNIATGTVHFSQQWARLLDYGAHEVIPTEAFFHALVHPDDAARTSAALAEHVAGRTPVRQYEVRLRTRAGDYRWFLDRGKVVAWDGAGRPARMVGTINDITERIRAEDAVAHSVASLRATLDSTADGILTIGPDKRIESFNRPFAELWGIPPDVLASRDDDVALASVLGQLQSPELFLQKVRYLYDHPLEESFDQLDFTDGRVVERVSRPMLVEGRATGRVWSFRDITERTEAKRRLAAFAKMGRQLSATDQNAAAARIIMGIADELFAWDSCSLDLYDAATDRCQSILTIDIVDGRRQDVAPSRVNAAPTPRMRRAIEQAAELVLREEPVTSGPGDLRFGDLSRPSASVMIVPMRDGPKVVGVLSIQSYRLRAYTPADLEAMQSLADSCAGALVRIQATSALGASEERLRLVWESATDGMRLTDAEGRIVGVNEAFCAIMGRPRKEIEGRPLSDFYAEAERERILARHRERFARRDVPAAFERQLQRWDGRVLLLEGANRFIETDPSRPLLLGVFRDITERRLAEHEREKMQTRLFQNQKFEALGTLAGGVAHDFNNILMGMMNYTALAREDCPADRPEIREFLGEVLKGGHRAKELVRQILLLSRSEDAARAPLQAALILREALSLLRSTIPAAVEITAQVDQNAPLILANATQIHQVVMNLGINAAHAMQAHGGRLTVKLGQRTVDSALAAVLPDLLPGVHLWLEVTDTGTGMEPAVVARMFEPFFTTKKVGEGTGLGLAVVRSVVRSHRGAINVRTKPGAGTTIELYFPVLVAAAPVAGEVGRPLPRGQGQRILLVDDEAMVVRSMQLVMQRFGYVVTACNRPERALELFESAPGDVDLLVTDFQMPGMTGVELAGKILALRPGLPVLVASGFAGDFTEEKIRELGLRGLIRKPIEMAELAEVLARIFRAAV